MSQTSLPIGSSKAKHTLSALLVGLAMTACVSDPTRYHAHRSAAQAPPPPSTQVYFYPTAGQSKARQERDRYECYRWAVDQTGFDPGALPQAPRERTEVRPAPAPGHDTAVGAAAGAIIGAAVAGPSDAGEGAVAGAIAGAAIGAASDAARQAHAERVQQQYERRDARELARLERKAGDYRRAMAACLEGRGYSVK